MGLFYFVVNPVAVGIFDVVRHQLPKLLLSLLVATFFFAFIKRRLLDFISKLILGLSWGWRQGGIFAASSEK